MKPEQIAQHKRQIRAALKGSRLNVRYIKFDPSMGHFVVYVKNDPSWDQIMKIRQKFDVVFRDAE